MRTKTETKLNHKVPQFLLRNFASKKITKEKKKDQYYIHLFNKESGKTGEPNIIGACSENKFYDFPNTKIEEAFEQVESKTTPIVNKIISEKTIANLTFDEKQQLAVFISCQWVRTDAFRENQQIIINTEKASFEDSAAYAGIDLSKNEQYQNLKFSTETEEGKKLSHISSFRPEFLYLCSSIIMNKDWILFETDDSNPFIIGDSPVILHNSSETFPYLGLEVPEIEIYLPISSKFTLGFWCKSIHRKVEEGYKENEEKMICLKQTYNSLTPKQILEVQNLINKQKAQHSIISSIKKQISIIIDSERLKFFNLRQIAFAEKFVYSRTNDFSLAKELIATNPAHKKGWNIKAKLKNQNGN